MKMKELKKVEFLRFSFTFIGAKELWSVILLLVLCIILTKMSEKSTVCKRDLSVIKTQPLHLAHPSQFVGLDDLAGNAY
jgi:hypothetical protein